MQVIICKNRAISRSMLITECNMAPCEQYYANMEPYPDPCLLVRDNKFKVKNMWTWSHIQIHVSDNMQTWRHIHTHVSDNMQTWRHIHIHVSNNMQTWSISRSVSTSKG